jgi:SAM-dependent MidA family methyltransferase
MHQEPLPLVEKLRERIRREGSITYETFIAAALYDQDHGYYKSGKQDHVDYVTSPEIHSAFGALIGRYIEKQCLDVGVTNPVIVECGGASGMLAHDILHGFTYLEPESYFIVENGGDRTQGIIQWITTIDQLPPDMAFTVVIANELFDALPFHRIVNNNGVLREMYIDWDHGFFEKPGPLSSDVESFLEKYPITLPAGQSTEVTTATLSLVGDLSRRVHKGCFLIFDYGYHMVSLEAGGFADGSALGYVNRQINSDILSCPGRMDITHHVNFDHLTSIFKDCGWAKAGEIEQYRFLLNNGILEDLVALPDDERLRAKWLINPEGLGSMVFALGFTRGVSMLMPGFGRM